MPVPEAAMRRLVVAIAVLLIGVLGVGVVTAVGRKGDNGSPRAQPSASSAPFSEPPSTEPTGEPSAEPSATPSVAPTAVPTGVPSSPPATSGNGAGNGGDGSGSGGDGTPDMPNTGASPALALGAAFSLSGAALALRARRTAY